MGIQVTCALCWNGHVMGSLCFLVTNARRDICPPRRRHEIGSRALIISLEVSNVLEVGRCPCTLLKHQQCPCKYSITDRLRLSIFSLFEACYCQDSLDPSLGITLPPALLYLCAIYPDPETP